MKDAVNKEFLSWGRIKLAKSKAYSLSGEAAISLGESPPTCLAYGLGRSYGDSCLNSNGTILETVGQNHFISFDRKSGILCCEAGISLDEILKVIVPSGWFLPTTPGTKFITLGGAVANDIHGKNHHVVGSFGNNVIQLTLLRSDGRTLTSSPTENEDWFQATIGGLGLTGLITTVTIQLKKISSSYIDVNSIPFSNIDEFFEISKQQDKNYEHTVSWIDCLAKGENLGQGIYMGGNYSSNTKNSLNLHSPPKVSIPFEAPKWLLNPLNIKLFNTFYYNLQKMNSGQKNVHYDPFFYPLDKLNNWNKLYGRRGFYQYQSVIPQHNALEATREMLQEISKSKQGSFLAVLKTFGDIPPMGMLSFCRPGVTLALDFPNNGEKIHLLFERLDNIVHDAGGSLYPAKDARMSKEFFHNSHSKLSSFIKYVDPSFSSDFWKRVCN